MEAEALYGLFAAFRRGLVGYALRLTHPTDTEPERQPFGLSTSSTSTPFIDLG